MSPTALQVNHSTPPRLTGVEVEVIGLFVNAVRVIGLPKSVGEIYGLLFINPVPLPLDELVARLEISKGSASQGLKVLRGFGAVRQIYVGGDRRDHYEAETELKRLVAGFLHGQMKPHLDGGSGRLTRIREVVDAEGGSQEGFYASRLSKLQQWHSRSQNLLPLISGLLD